MLYDILLAEKCLPDGGPRADHPTLSTTLRWTSLGMMDAKSGADS